MNLGNQEAGGVGGGDDFGNVQYFSMTEVTMMNKAMYFENYQISEHVNSGVDPTHTVHIDKYRSESPRKWQKFWQEIVVKVWKEES